jgi:pantoate--beta-alanine ligase
MQVISTVAEFRMARREFPDLGLVPTMGFLHAGHLSLVERALAECGAVAVSIFVNPTQFGPNEDLAQYPRDVLRDLELLRQAGAALVFTPTPEEIYPSGFASRVEVGAIGDVLEGAIRPGHFSGVATVVSKLFNIVQPSRAYFGQKDAQQCAVIRRFVRDLDVPVEVVVIPTMREPDGLAMSSRNSYLTAVQRGQASVLYRGLCAGRDAFRAGERDAGRLCQLVRAVLATEPDLVPDYVSVADPGTLVDLQRVDGPALVSVAARLGRTRLIDNVVLEPIIV